MITKVIRVFEYQTIKIGDVISNIQITDNIFKELCKLNEQEEGKYFKIGYKKISFLQYVGVIQVCSISIEIYPKVDKFINPNEKDNLKWKSLFLEMLSVTQKINPKIVKNASLQLEKIPLIDIFVLQFLDSVQKLVYQGLSRKYVKQVKNDKVLKGRFVFQKHLQKNQIHKELFYIETPKYDLNNPYNRIIKAALQILSQKSFSFNNYISSLLLSFEQIVPLFPTKKEWTRYCVFNRTTKNYEKSLNYSKFILQNLSPDFSSGSNDTIAFLFDMNKLFEDYILYQFKKSSLNYKDMKVTGQQSKLFWGNKRIRPDIVLEYEGKTYIVDTKWKIPATTPCDADIKQMYVYNHYWKSNKAFLLYPRCERVSQETICHKFYKPNLDEVFDHSLSMLYYDIHNTLIINEIFTAILDL